MSHAGGSQQLEQLLQFIPSKAAEGFSKGLGWSHLSTGGNSWGGVALLCSWAGTLARIKALGIAKHSIVFWGSGVWWEVGPLGFTHFTGTAGGVGLCVRAMAGEGGCGVKVPVHPRG